MEVTSFASAGCPPFRHASTRLRHIQFPHGCNRSRITVWSREPAINKIGGDFLEVGPFAGRIGKAKATLWRRRSEKNSGTRKEGVESRLRSEVDASHLFAAALPELSLHHRAPAQAFPQRLCRAEGARRILEIAARSSQSLAGIARELAPTFRVNRGLRKQRDLPAAL